MWELVAFGTDSSAQLTRTSLREGVPMRIGRAPRDGWKIGWDRMISREHADVVVKDGVLEVSKLAVARNAILFNGDVAESFQCRVGDVFRIGATSFEFVKAGDVQPFDVRDPLSEFAFSSQELEGWDFAEPEEAAKLISTLPVKIAADDVSDLASKATQLVLECMPEAELAGIVRRSSQTVSTLDILGWSGRDKFNSTFRPSVRLLKESVRQRAIIMYVWSDDEASSDLYTVSGVLDWSVCLPMESAAAEGHCLYISGKLEDEVSPVEMVETLRKYLPLLLAISRQIEQGYGYTLLKQQRGRLSQFFSPAVLETLTESNADATLNPREGDITALFCDLRGFSRKAEEFRDRLLVLLERVNHALSTMTRYIMSHEGAIADFQGDAALAFWGWPSKLEEGPLPACQAALEILDAFTEAARQPQHVLAGFRVGIGIGHGNAVAGMIGSENQAKVGVFGDTVNTASRLEGMTKQFGAAILLDEATAKCVANSNDEKFGRVRELGRVLPKGKGDALNVYELLSPRSIGEKEIEVSNLAVKLFQAGEWANAKATFERLAEEDGLRQFFTGYIEKHTAPPDGWNGVLKLTKK